MQNASGIEDLRVRRTRKMLLQALIDLTIERGFAAVTVQDIAERAMVNRATFYRHYLDKYDLLEQYMNDVYIMTEPQNEIPDQAPPGLVTMLEHVQQNADFFRVMLGRHGDAAFAHKIQQYIEERFRSHLPAEALQPRPGVPPIELLLSYVSYAGIGAIVWWLDNLHTTSPEQIATWLEQWSRLANLADV